VSEKSQVKEIPEWQRKVAFATNAAGAVAGPAAIWMATKQAREKKGGMPRQAVEAASRKFPGSRVLRRTGRVLKHPAAIAAGGVTAVGLQAANWTGDTIAASALKKQPKEEASKAMARSYEEIVEKSDRVVRGSGHGQSLVSKRYYDSEADRQRRLGTYAGLGGGTALVLGEATRRQFKGDVIRDAPSTNRPKGRIKRLEVGLKPLKNGNPRSPRNAILLGTGAALAAAGGAAAYKRGISERNRPYS